MDIAPHALEGYAGALVVVAHDRRTRARCDGAHLELGAGRITRRTRRGPPEKPSA